MEHYGDSRRRTLIGVALILLVAAGLVAAPAGGDVIEVVSTSLRAGFLAAIAYALWRLYRERSGWFAELPEQHRAILYAALAVALLTIVAIGRFREFGGGMVLWIALLAGCGLAAFWVWRESRRFSY